MDLNNLESLKFSGPELILTGTIILLIALDLFMRNKRNLAIVAIIGCAVKSR
jgi:hypothetical protein